MRVEYLGNDDKLGRVCNVEEMTIEEFKEVYDAKEVLSITDDYDEDPPYYQNAY